MGDVDARIAAKFAVCRAEHLWPSAAQADGGRVAAPAATDAGGPGGGGTRPPLGNTGDKNPNGPTVGLDWVRCVGPVALVGKVRTRMAASFGPSEPAKARWFYDAGERFPESVLLFWHNGTGSRRKPPSEWTCCIDIPGSPLGLLGEVGTLDLLRWLLDLGMHCTRIDGRIDLRERLNGLPDGDGVGMIDAARASCAAGELCRARTWQPWEKWRSSERIEYGFNVGVRGGNGSGRYVRLYDKGLESGTCKLGQWERWEAQLEKDVAKQAAPMVAAAENPAEVITGLALGAVEFRENNGRSERDRRPLVAWYAALLGAVQARRLTQTRTATTLERYAGWVVESVAPGLQDIAKATSQTMGQVLDDLTANGTAVRSRFANPADRPVAHQYRRERLNTLRLTG